MGFTHDTGCSQYVPAYNFTVAGGTWSTDATNNIIQRVRVAADAAFNLYVPVPLPSNSAREKGSLLKSMEFFYGITVADCEDFGVAAFYSNTYNADGTLASTLLTTSLDAAHATAALRKVQGDHKLIATLDQPVWMRNDQSYWLRLAVDPALTSVFKTAGAIINYTLRA